MSIKVSKGGITTEIEKWDVDFYKRTGWTIEGEKQESPVEEKPVEVEETPVEEKPVEVEETPVEEKPSKAKK